MTVLAGEARIQANEGLRGAAGAREHGIADTSTLFLQVVEEAAGPDELGGENSQTQQDGEPTGARRHNHQDAESEQGKSEDNLQDSLRLLDALDPHGLLTQLLRC